MRGKIIASILTIGLACNMSIISYAETPIELGEKVEVTTSYGSYNITVEKIVISDWMERLDKNEEGREIVLLECDIENIDFADSYSPFFLLENYMSVIDNEGYVVNVSSSGYNTDGEYTWSPEVPKGAKAKVLVPYVINTGIDKLSININEQYSLEASIQNVDKTDVETENMKNEVAVEEWQLEINKLTDENEKLESENEELNNRIEELEAERKQLENSVTTLENEKSNLQYQIEELTKENEESKPTEIETEVVELETESEQLFLDDKDNVSSLELVGGEFKNNSIYIPVEYIVDVWNKMLDQSNESYSAFISERNEYAVNISIKNNTGDSNCNVFLLGVKDDDSFVKMTVDITNATTEDADAIKSGMFSMVMLTVPNSDNYSDEAYDLYTKLINNLNEVYQANGLSYQFVREDDVIALKIWVTDYESGYDEEKANSDPEAIKSVQNILNYLGYECGTADGVSGTNTIKAIRKYQQEHGLDVTGTITEELYLSFDALADMEDKETVDTVGVNISTFISRYNEATDYYNAIAERDGYSKANYITEEMIKKSKSFSPNNNLKLCVNPNSLYKSMIGIINVYCNEETELDIHMATGEMMAMIYALDPNLSDCSDALDIWTELNKTSEYKKNGILYDNYSFSGLIMVKGAYEGFEIVKE